MQDNELYSYFREWKDTFNQVPDNSLWQKIDSGLTNTPAATATTAKLTLIKKLAIGVVSGITVTAAVLVYNNKPSAIQEKPKEIVLPAPTVVSREVTAPEPVVEKPQDTVKKKKIKKISKTVPFRTINDTLQTKPAIKSFKAFKTPSAADSVKKIIPTILTQQYGTTIKISTKEILSKAAFDTLVAQSLKTYRTQSGKILVVMADSHKSYRKVIGVLKEKDLVKIKGLRPVVDTIKPINFSKENLIDSLKSYTNSNLIEAYAYSDGKVYYGDQVEVQPQYPGSIKAFYKLIQNNIKAPEELKEELSIYISYIIEKDGSLSTIEVKEDLPCMKEQAEKALKKAKKWKPARVNGRNVRYKYTLPFTLKPL